MASDGGVFTFGDAAFHGSTGDIRLNSPIVGMAVTPSGGGYWMVASDGGVFTFGDAAFHGSTGDIRLNSPIVGMAVTPSGGGYWMVASDGGVFTFGDAAFHGSTGDIRLNSPIVGMAVTPSGGGYWMVASDGGVFTFGDAAFHGSTASSPLGAPVRALVPGDGGYWIVAANGRTAPFGAVPAMGSTPRLRLPVVAASTRPAPAASGPASTPPAPTPAPPVAIVPAAPTGTEPPATMPSPTSNTPVVVTAAVETEPVLHTGDAADDSAVWVHPTDPAQSTLITTDKQGGLSVHDLSGRRLSDVPTMRTNNVDLHAGTPLLGGAAVVAVSDIGDKSIALFRVEPATRALVRVDARRIAAGIGLYGLCMYHSVTGRVYVIDSDQSGTVQQWELSEAAGGTLDATLVRTFRTAGPTEGCVVDDEAGRLYLSEEAVGIWSYDAEPSSVTARPPFLVGSVASGQLTADVEGLGIYVGPGGTGYLVASSQGDDRYAVYDRLTGRFVGLFRIGTAGIDGTSHTDGLEVTSANLGGAFANGMVIAQDDRNDTGYQNFKLVPWSAVAAAFTPALLTTGPAPVPSPGTTFHVDPVAGSDAADGRTPATAWRTPARASSATLFPGDRVLLRRGSTATGMLAITSSGTAERPIAIGAYGSGERPRITGASTCLRVSGSHVVVVDLHLDDCSWAGAELVGNDVGVERSRITRNAAGVFVKSTALRSRVIGNEIVDNNKMSVLTPEPGGDSGAFGVLLHGDEAEVAHNTISGSDAFSYDYGRDGAAVEVYGGRNNHVHHNVARDNDAFTELGNDRSSGNVYAYNLVTSTLPTSTFVVTRGALSSYGPVLATTLLHNTVVLTGAESQGVVCHAGCGPTILRMRGNVVQAVAKTAYADAPFDEDQNVYWGGRTQIALGLGSRIADPAFVDVAALDLRLLPASPAIDLVTPSSYLTDLAGGATAVDGNGDGVGMADAGVFEYRP